MHYIASTLTCDTDYTAWTRQEDGRLVKGRSVLIKGGFGLADKNFVTVQGAKITKIDEEDLEFLKSNWHFDQHSKSGFVKVLQGRSAPDGERAIDGMQAGDRSQPKSPGMYKEKGEALARGDVSVMSHRIPLN